MIDDDTIRLRAERAGDGSARIYTLTYRTTDFVGNSAFATAVERVLHGKGK